MIVNKDTKKDPDSTLMGDLAEYLVTATMRSQGYVCNTCRDRDIGIDFFAEIPTEYSNNKRVRHFGSGYMFAAQVKSTQKVNNKIEIRKKDYDYWKELRMPVVLFLVCFKNFTLPYYISQLPLG